MGNGTKRVYVGGLAVGAGAPVSVQSMTCTDTKDVDATVAQIHALTDAGCDIVRCAVYDRGCADALAEIRPQISVPLVADIHFDYRLAIAAMEKGADKIRFNPGNIGDAEHVRSVAACATEHNVPIRIGVNGGSLAAGLLEKNEGNLPAAMVESALTHCALLEDAGFYNIVISLKASGVAETVAAYRLLSQKCDYPLHIGVTEAGLGEMAVVKSAIGIGSLLLDGIGDTLRVSLTGDPVREVEMGIAILRALRLRKTGIEVISCPTCARCRVNVEQAVREVQRRLPKTERYLKVAVMGCAVNGPGEAKDADIGIAFGHGNGVIFKKGQKLASGEMPGILDRLIEETAAMLA